MPYLVVSLGGQTLCRHPLTGPTVLGRSVDANLHVRDASLSRWHCRFEPAGDPPNVWTVVDLGSRNGTFLNGRRVHRAVLCPGDLLRAGRTAIAFQAGEISESPESGWESGLLSADVGLPSDDASAGQPAPTSVTRATRSRTQRAAAPAPRQASPAASFPKPLLVPESRLPRPNPSETPARPPSPPGMETLSSPGWSRHAGKKPPSPSVDLSSGTMSPGPDSNTVDLFSFPVADGRKAHTPRDIETPPGWFRRLRGLFRGLFRR